MIPWMDSWDRPRTLVEKLVESTSVWSLIPRNVPINVGFSVLTSWQWKMLMLEGTAWGAHKISPCYFYHLSVNPGIITNQKVYKPTEDKLKTKSSMSSKTDDQVFSALCLVSRSILALMHLPVTVAWMEHVMCMKLTV